MKTSDGFKVTNPVRRADGEKSMLIVVMLYNCNLGKRTSATGPRPWSILGTTTTFATMVLNTGEVPGTAAVRELVEYTTVGQENRIRGGPKARGRPGCN